MACPKESLLFAGVGGMMPTISKLASSYVTDPSNPLPEIGLFVGLLLFFLIGAILAWVFSETNVKQAFILGVCAPGIITNIVAGVNEANTSAAGLQSGVTFGITSSALAQDRGENRLILRDTNRETRRLRTVEIAVDPENAGSWALRHILVTVSYIQENGKVAYATSFPAYAEPPTIQIPPDAVALQVNAGNQKTVQAFPDDPFVAAKFLIRLTVKGTNDFLWALGVKRKPVIHRLETELVTSRLPQ